MEAAYVLGLGGCAWLGGFALVGGGLHRARAEGWRTRRLRRLAGVAAERLAALPLVHLLAGRDDWGLAADEFGGLVAQVGLATSREGSCALLLAGGFLAGVVLALLFGTWLALPLAAFLLAVGVPLWGQSTRRRRERELAQAMPGVFRTLAMVLASGETLSQAIDYLGSNSPDVVAPAFARVSLRLRCGISVEGSMDALREELEAPGVGLLATALTISQRTGSPLRELFEHAAQMVERQGEFQRLLAVKTAQVRLSARVVCALPAILIGVLSLVSPDFRSGLATLFGAGCVLVAAGMDALALLIIRRLMRGVL